MATEVTPEILDAIEAVIRQHRDGIAVEDLANAFDPPPSQADMHIWLQALSDQRRTMFFRRNGRTICRLPEFVLRTPAANPPVNPTAPGPAVGGSAPASENVAAAPIDPGAGVVVPGATGDLAALPPFVALFSQCVLPIVGRLMPRASVTAFLQVQAGQTFETPEERSGYLAYALTQIDAITPEVAPECGLISEQVAAWR